MEVPYAEGVASHSSPESCAGMGNHVCEALTGEGAGQVLSREILYSRAPTLSSGAEGNTVGNDIASCRWALRGHRPCACTQAPCAGAGRSHD